MGGTAHPRSAVRKLSVLKRGLLPAAVAALALAVSASPANGGGRDVEVVVGLEAPPLARAVATSRALAATAKGRRLSLKTPFSAAYLRRLASAQRTVERGIAAAIPDAGVRWRYRIVLNGLAVVVPRGQAARLGSVPGVARVYPNVRYHGLLDDSPGLIGAPALWGAQQATAGSGIKIGIVDDGLDQRHPFFDPARFAMPAGFPKGNAAFTTAKVVAARAFPPPSPRWRYADRPFDPQHSVHGTHVAGIAAGNTITVSRTSLSGVAPGAYLGNYKVLTIPTESNVGLDGNAPEIAAGIEAAVRDGMDVVNLSLGEPEIAPARDLVVQAINAAADAGVVPAIAAGNDFDGFGRGSLSSPGSASKAITAAAVTKGKVIANFSSSGPTPVSLQLKPDVSAPGVSILSSVPATNGLWQDFSGTSMAAPHVAGAAALLQQRHPSWTVAQVKSALVLTGDPVLGSTGTEAPTTREGGGLIYLPRADSPLVFAEPTAVSFGLLRGGETAARAVQLTDAGGGAGAWSVSVAQRAGAVVVSAPATAIVPGRLDLVAAPPPGSAEAELTGFVVLSRGAERRRVPYWLRVTAPRLGRQPHGTLRRTGTYRGDTRRGQALVDEYRYPDNPAGVGVPVQLEGPEQVFRVTVAAPVANFGVAILRQGRGTDVQPRVVAADDENRQIGYTSLPINLNPYLTSFLRPVNAAGVVLPTPGSYDVVFDSTTRSTAGPFTFRFWIGDAKPPTVRLLSRSVRRGRPLRFRITDAGSGVWPGSLAASIDGQAVRVRYSAGRATVALAGVGRGRHTVVIRASDYQETRNMENVYRILPNSTRKRLTFRVR
jgi:subtilisin family serine protease